MPLVPKRVKFWPESLRNDLYDLEEDAREAICQALQDAKFGFKSSIAKAHGEDERLAGVMKISKTSEDGNTYRTVYTIEFEEALWVFDVYAKKSKSGASTPKRDIDRTVGRLKSLRAYRSTIAGRKMVSDLVSDLRRRDAEQKKKQERFNATRT